MIEFSRELNKEEQLVAQRVIQRNGFYAHPENVLEAMLTEKDVSFRQMAVEKILTLCMEAEKGGSAEEEEAKRKNAQRIEEGQAAEE